MISRSVDIILGKTGSGKTTLARSLVKPLTRTLILDAGFEELGGLTFYTLDELGAYLDKSAGKGGAFRASYTPLNTEWALMLEIARRLGEIEPITLVLEEADRLPLPKELAEYDELISRGRHYGVNMIAISLYPYKIPAELRRQATAIYSFYQHEPRDLAYLEDVYGGHLETLQALGPYEYLKWTRTDVSKGKTKI